MTRPNSSARPRSLAGISRDLKALAPGPSAGETALRDLADRLLTTPTDLAGIDLAAAYPPETMLAGGTSPRSWVHLAELARDTLVFLPVVYTWWKLSQALRAYDSSAGTEPFLLGWQNGFGGRTEALSTSALVVSAMVLTIILLTVVTHVARTRLEATARERRQRLAVHLVEANLLINQARVAAPSVSSEKDLRELGAGLARSTRTLEEALSKIGERLAAVPALDTGPSSKLHSMFVEWTAAARELSDFGKRLDNTQRFVEGLGKSQDTVSEKVERLITAIAADRTQSSQEVHARLAVAEEVKASAATLGEAMRGLGERAEQFNELVLRLAYIIENLEATDSGSPALGGGYR